jgi:hypothetical protein
MRYLSLCLAALLYLLLSASLGAAPPIIIDTITGQCVNNAPAIIVTMNQVTWGFWKNTQLYYHNPPGSPSILQWPSNTNPATFNVSTAGSFQITNNPSGSVSGAGITPSAIYPHPMPSCGGAPKKGMTWAHTKSNAQTGTITVGCSGCDASHGDTVCTQSLPLLCIYKPPTPFQLPAGVSNADQYNLWSGGVVATTLAVAGSTLTQRTDADSYCQGQLGPGWRVAEFHEGWGWNFQAYGGTVTAPTVPSTRFWVHIKDKTGPTGANCWLTP